MIDIYTNEATVDRVTKRLVSQGTSIFQIWKKGTTDSEHCRWLLDLAQFPLNAHVLDIACGIGATASYMQALRPDLKFSLQNISPSQLALCPIAYPLACHKFQGNMDMLDNVPNEAFDAAMLCYALGHVHSIELFLYNAARVLKPGGVLFVYDMQAKSGHEKWVWDTFNYRTYTAGQLALIAWYKQLFSALQVLEEVRDAGLNCLEFLNRCPDRTIDEMDAYTWPVGYRFVKSKQVFGPQQAQDKHHP